MLHCAQCGAQLAHDQRYCVECGARRGALPRHISGSIAAIMERGRRVASPGRSEAEPLVAPPARSGLAMPTPRAAAAAVIAMLGFGVFVGSLAAGNPASLAKQLILAVTPSHQSPAPSLGGAAPAESGSSVPAASSSSSSPSSSQPASAASQPAASSNLNGVGASSPTGSTSTLPPIKHVFLIVLSDQGFNQTFGHSMYDPYLAKTLAKQGELVPNYYAVAGSPLANEIALVSGQGPTPQTVQDCSVYSNIVPGTRGARGQILGDGCVYPKRTETLANQLMAAHLTWKAYVQTRKKNQAEACIHPKLGSPDFSLPSAKDPYVTWRNPFMYFHSLTNRGSCAKDDVGIGQLAKDLKSASTTPAFSYIVPDVCDDGSDVPCGPQAKAGLGPAEAFLKSVVPEIKRSPGYKDGGLIAITFDGAPQTGPNADPSSCCNNPTYPNLPPPGAPVSTPPPTTTAGSPVTTTPASTPTTTTPTTTTAGGAAPPATMTSTPTSTTTTNTTTTPTSTTTTPTTTTTTPVSLGSGQTNPTGGGGQVGLLLISQYVKAGTLDVTDYFNHFSLLASIEQLFGLKRLAYAADPSLPVFGPAVYSAYNG